MNRRQALWTLLLATASCQRSQSFQQNPDSGRFKAFSLREAQRHLRSGSASPEVSGLAGITRLLGAVYDRAGADVIVVGRAYAPHEAVELNDLVAAFRAVLVEQEFPLVSIDRTTDTPTTGKQRIRFNGFKGEKRHCGYANKLLSADILLKKAALGLLPHGRLPISSYFDICMEALRANDQTTSVTSRLWFYPLEPSLLVRDEVAAIRELRIGVRTEILNGPPGAHDAIGDDYADAFTNNLGAIGKQFPDVQRLKALYDTVAIARGVQSFKGADLGFWLHDYLLPVVQVPLEFDLLHRRESIERSGQTLVLELNGGIDTRVFAQRLRDGDHTALQDAVLRSRPSPSHLQWDVPLQGWRFAVDRDTTPEPIREDLLPGAYINRQITSTTTFPSPTTPDRGGVTTEIRINPEDFRRKP